MTEEQYEFMKKRKNQITLPTIAQPLPLNLKNQPKVLLLDIETLPMEVYVWGLYKQRIPHGNIIRDWTLVSWAAKWLYDSEVFGDCLTPKEALARDDERIVRSVWEALDEADIVIAHNGVKFDVRKLNARFFVYKMVPPMPYQIIDTLKESQKQLGLSSHRMDYISKLISSKGKLDTDFQLWIDCCHGDATSLEYMYTYNKNDVLILEEAYLELRPWIKSHPNIFIIGESDEACCPYCGSTDIIQKGRYVTIAGEYDAIRCNGCGGVSRRRTTNLNKVDRKRLLIPTAK